MKFASALFAALPFWSRPDVFVPGGYTLSVADAAHSQIADCAELPARDYHDARVIAHVINNTGAIVADQNDLA